MEPASIEINSLLLFRQFPWTRRDINFTGCAKGKKDCAQGVATQSCFDISSLTSSVCISSVRMQPALSSATHNLTYWLAKREANCTPRNATDGTTPAQSSAGGESERCAFSTPPRFCKTFGESEINLKYIRLQARVLHQSYEQNFYLCATKSWHCAPINKALFCSLLFLATRQTWPV